MLQRLMTESSSAGVNVPQPILFFLLTAEHGVFPTTSMSGSGHAPGRAESTNRCISEQKREQYLPFAPDSISTVQFNGSGSSMQ